MMKWIVQFIDENKEKWDKIKKQKKLDIKLQTEKEEWEAKTKEEKIKLLQEEKIKKRTSLKENKERRLEEVLRMKENWKRREVDTAEDEGEKEEEEIFDPEEEGGLGHQNTGKAVDNGLMAKARAYSRFKREPPGPNTLSGRPKHEIVSGENPLALRNGRPEKGGTQPKAPEAQEDKNNETETEREDEEEKGEEEDPFEEEIEPELMEEQEKVKVGEKVFLGSPSSCLECVSSPCLCTLLSVELRTSRLTVIRELVSEMIEEATTRRKEGRKRKREGAENQEEEDRKEKQVQVKKGDGHSECGRSHSLCPTQKIVQGECEPPAHIAGDEQSLTSTNGSHDPDKCVTTNKITQQRPRNKTTPDHNKQQGEVKQQETPTNPPTRNLTRVFGIKLKQSKIQFKPATELEKTTNWLDKNNQTGNEKTTSNQKTTVTTTKAKTKLTDHQTTTANNKIPEKQNRVEDEEQVPEIPSSTGTRLTVKLRQPQLRFEKKTTTITTPTDNIKKPRNDNKHPKGKTTNVKVTGKKKKPSIEGYITTKRSKNNDQKDNETTTITTTKTKVPTNPTEQTTKLDNKRPNQTTKAKSDSARKTTKKMRLKPPDIDKLTPVSLKIKVRGTEVTDMKTFLARKKLERDKKCKVLPTSRAETVVSGENMLPTISKPNTEGRVARQIVGYQLLTRQCSD